MNAGEPECDDLLAELLVKADEQLAGGTAHDAADTSSIAESGDLPPDWERGLRCLELLHRVRKEWSPDDVAESLPPPHFVEESATVTAGGMLETVPDPAGTELGRFRILRELGRGGLGIVYLAYDPKLNREVALKVPRLEALASRDMRRRFLQEAEAAARLNHPHLITVYDSGEDGPICYIAAEFCPGPTLAQWINGRTSPVPIAMAARIIKQLAEAVQHAHGRGVLHRDIKPANVLMCSPVDHHPHEQQVEVALPRASDAEALSPKLTDFGMAKLLERAGDETRNGALVGTPAYMAPEQARGDVRAIDARADVYALGAVLYEVLTGRRTFSSESEIDSLRRVLFDEPTPLRKLRKQIPRDLETICQKALAKDPRERYQTAGAMAADLGRFLEHEPILARRLHPVEKGWRCLKRRPLVAAVLVMAIVAAAALELSRRTSNANFALQGYRNVTFTTEPAGAELAIVRLSDQSSEPDPTQVTRPTGRTPLSVYLKPGDYLVVAALDQQRFHEVYRRVPRPDEISGRPAHHLSSDVDRSGNVQLPKIRIHSVSGIEDMAAIPCRDLANAAERQRGDSPVLYVDCDEMSVAGLSRQLAQIRCDQQTTSNFLDIFHNHKDYCSAVEIAERLGKRLPSDAEFECIADSYSARQEEPNSIDPHHPRRVKQAGDIKNLFTELGEWTTTSLPTVREGAMANAPDFRIVRGIASNVSPGAPDTDARHGAIVVGRTEQRADIGFRCVRSSVPRFLDY